MNVKAVSQVLRQRPTTKSLTISIPCHLLSNFTKMILGKKKKGSSDKRTKSSASRELSKSKQTGISHGGAGGRQKTNKTGGSGGKIKSKSPVKSNYKSFESLASCRDRYKTQEMSNFLFLNQFVNVFQTGFR